MRNIFLFIRRYFNFILFLFLQVYSIALIIQYNTYYNAFGTEAFNEVTGKVNTNFNQLHDYIQLKKISQQLVKENEQLRNRLKEDFLQPDTAMKLLSDTFSVDSIIQQRKWLYMNAKVVSNSFNAPNNFIVLNRGRAEHLQRDAGVVDPANGVVGIVMDVSEHFAVVMSLLHKDSKISVKLKKGGEGGQVTWDGVMPNRLLLTGIKKSAKVVKGDTVLTSGFTTTFPFGMLVGTIEEIKPDQSTNDYIIKLKSAANFYNLNYVYAIDNSQKDEINKLLEKAKNKINN